MANNIAFQPMGNTVALTVTASSSNTAVTSLSPVNQVMISNAGANAAFVTISNAAAVTATVPTAGSPTSSFCVPGNTIKVISALQSSPTRTVYVAAIGSGNTNLYVTPGEGL